MHLYWHLLNDEIVLYPFLIKVLLITVIFQSQTYVLHIKELQANTENSRIYVIRQRWIVFRYRKNVREIRWNYDNV